MTHRETAPRPLVPAAVRRWLYGIAAAVAPLLAAYGLVTDSTVALWLNLVGAVLLTMAAGNTPARPAEGGEPDA